MSAKFAVRIGFTGIALFAVTISHFLSLVVGRRLSLEASRWRWLRSRSWLRLLGLLLLILLLVRLDLGQVVTTLRKADLRWILGAVLLILPLITLKAIRWQGILTCLSIRLDLATAVLAYFASLFIGFLTPGRLGEFSRTAYARGGRTVSGGVAFSSVLADRLFDLCALLTVGAAALLSLGDGTASVLILVFGFSVVTLAFVLFYTDRSYRWFRRQGERVGVIGRVIFAEGGWLSETRRGLKQLTLSRMMTSAVLTGSAYLIFFTQCHMLARSLQLSVAFSRTAYAVSLGSLITLIPVSISGLGTREATITAYLGSVGVRPEAALSFSFLVFATFHLAGGTLGALAFWLRPISLPSGPREDEEGES